MSRRGDAVEAYQRHMMRARALRTFAILHGGLGDERDRGSFLWWWARAEREAARARFKAVCYMRAAAGFPPMLF